MEKNDIISRAAALDVLVTSPNFHTTLTRIEELPTVDAIPVEWLRNLCTIAKMEIDDEMFIDWLIQTWQEEQEENRG